MRTKDEILQGENESLFLMKCRMDFGFFYTRVMGRILKPFHKEWVDILRNNSRIAIAAPTGFGKTEMFGVGYCLYMCFFFPKSINIIVANTIRTQSAKILADIKLEIENNEVLLSLKPKDSRTT